MTLYVRYSKKPPHLPEAVAESTSELAKMLGITTNVITTSLSHGLITYTKIEVEEDGNDD